MDNIDLKTGAAVLFGLLTVSSCIYDQVPVIDESEDLSRIAVFIDSRADGATPAEEMTEKQLVLKRVDDLLDDGFVNNTSVFYISQDGTSSDIEPNFSSDDNDNLYTYVYYENPEAEWGPEEESGENIGGYNFTAVNGRALNWTYIENIGMVGNGYVFCGLYFPADNQVRFSVEKDQSVLANHRRSNILGAKHSTRTAQNRLRFRLYHLMVYLNVTLYIPVYDADDNTGYLEDAVRQGTLLGFYSDFNVNWAAESGADLSPDVSSDKESELTDIRMYLHPGSEETKIDISKFSDSDTDTGTERVRKYTLGVLFPSGVDDILSRDILRFTLMTPGGTEKNYVFSTSQIPTSSTGLSLEKGHISNLELYLPRHDSDAIVIGAEILDWTHAYSNMTVLEEDVNN